MQASAILRKIVNFIFTSWPFKKTVYLIEKLSSLTACRMTYLTSMNKIISQSFWVPFLLLLIFPYRVWAGGSAPALNLQSELVLSSSDVGRRIQGWQTKINEMTQLTWEHFEMNSPVHSEWNGIHAQGNWKIEIDPSSVSDQHVRFQLHWSAPRVVVDSMKLQGTIVRDLGGARVIINLASQCDGMQFEWPSAAIEIDATWANGWQSYTQTVRGDAAPVLSANCTGPESLQVEIQNALREIVNDRSGFEALVKETLQTQLETQFHEFRRGLLAPKIYALNSELEAVIQPLDWKVSARGSWRLPTLVSFRKPGEAVSLEQDRVALEVDEAEVNALDDSVWIFPANTLNFISSYLYKIKILKARVASSDIPGFQDLMGARLIQFFFWPDLLKFPKETNFWFDIRPSSAPKFEKLSLAESGRTQGELTTGLNVKQWAPAQDRYLPYMNFDAGARMQVSLLVQNSKLEVQLNPKSLKWNQSVAPEYSKFRKVNPRVSKSIVTKKLEDWLKLNMSWPIPSVDIEDGYQLTVKKVEPWRDTLRFPLSMIQK